MLSLTLSAVHAELNAFGLTGRVSHLNMLLTVIRHNDIKRKCLLNGITICFYSASVLNRYDAASYF